MQTNKERESMSALSQETYCWDWACARVLTVPVLCMQRVFCKSLLIGASYDSLDWLLFRLSIGRLILWGPARRQLALKTTLRRSTSSWKLSGFVWVWSYDSSGPNGSAHWCRHIILSSLDKPSTSFIYTQQHLIGEKVYYFNCFVNLPTFVSRNST